MISNIQTFVIAVLGTGLTMIGDVFINEATLSVGKKSSWQLALGCILFGLSGIFWFFVFKRLNFSGVVLLYLFLSVILAVAIDLVRYGNVPDIRAIIGLCLFVVALWLMRGYLLGH